MAFKIAKCIDNARWASPNGANNLVNYYYKISDLEGEEQAEYVILSHWITYICERQMSYEQIWNKGSYIFSHLVKHYQSGASIEELIKTHVKPKIDKNGNASKICFFVDDKEFSSRMINSDVVAIFRSFRKLMQCREEDKQHTGLYNYLNKECNINNMKELLFWMYDLSYNGVGSPIIFDNNKKCMIYNNSIQIEGIINPELKSNPHIYDISGFNSFGIFHSKRAICAVRDYFKDSSYSQYFHQLLINFDFIKNELDQLELPGDIWNNNTRFGTCMKSLGFDYGTKASENFLNVALRKAYDKHKDELTDCYPEQFDFTFDFAPKMCESKRCDICAFGKANKKITFNYKELKRFCPEKDNVICPVLLQYCGYYIDCKKAKDADACIIKLIDNCVL